MKRDPLAIATALWLGIAAVVIVAILSWRFVEPWLTKDSAPAWVQAIGSIVAILVSASIVWWQVTAQRLYAERDRERNALELEHRAAATITYALGVTGMKIAAALRAFESAASTEEYSRDWYPVADFEMDLRAIAVADISHLNDPALRMAAVIAVYDLECCVELIKEGVELTTPEFDAARDRVRLLLENRNRIFNHRQKVIYRGQIEAGAKLGVYLPDEVARILGSSRP